MKACCACGGGSWSGPAPAPPSATGTRKTWSNCKCKVGWSEESVGSCEVSCCNPDRDPFGEWCQVEDWECEGTDWGYCAPSGSEGVDPWQYEAGGCTDSPMWKDADGDDCRAYHESNWCNSEGVYNTGWREEWGTFASFAAGPLHE